MPEQFTELQQQVFNYVHAADDPKEVTIMEIMGEFDLSYDEAMDALKAIRKKIRQAYNDG